MLTDVSTFIQQVGFPIFVAIVLLFQVLNMHRENVRAIDALTDAIRSLDKCLVDRIAKLDRGAPWESSKPS